MSSLLNTLGINPGAIIVQAIGFVVLYIIVRTYLFPGIRAALDARQQEIAAGLKAAEDARVEAAKLTQDREQLLAQSREEGRALVQKAVQEAQTAREHLLAEAQQERDALLARGRQVLDVERKQAVLELRTEVSDLALKAASRAVGEAMDEQAHRRAIDAFIASLETESPAH
jgi:F-type H+-transporting ATPase subunit b